MSIAWSGQVTMARADWSDETGTTVTLKLPMNKEAHDRRNPFHIFTKRRKGRAGTRFMMACHTASEGVRHALYEDESMLAGWNDSQQNGHTVKLWLCNDGMGHPFEGINRTQELLVSLVELDEDQEPVDQKMRDKVEKQHATGKQKTSNVAAMLCRNPNFWVWMNDTMTNGGSVTNEELAVVYLRDALGVSSRAELDDPSNDRAIREFEQIRSDFAATQGDLF